MWTIFAVDPDKQLTFIVFAVIAMVKFFIVVWIIMPRATEETCCQNLPSGVSGDGCNRFFQMRVTTYKAAWSHNPAHTINLQ
jgi:hypothetical protein